MTNDLGIQASCMEQSYTHLTKLTRAYYVLFTKSLGFHWNITGPQFLELHAFLEEIYKELLQGMDGLAERIRTLEKRAPMTVFELSSDSFIASEGLILESREMLMTLKADYEAFIIEIRQILLAMKDTTDQGTEDLLVAHLRTFEKRAWMLRSLLSSTV